MDRGLREDWSEEERACARSHTLVSEENYSFKGKEKGEMGKLFKGIGNKLYHVLQLSVQKLFYFNSGPVRPFSQTGLKTKESYVDIFLSGLVSDGKTKCKYICR